MDYSKRRPMSDALRTATLSEEARSFLAGAPPSAEPEQPAVVTGERPTPNPPPAPNPPAPPAHPTLMPPRPPPHLSVVMSAIVSMTFRLPAALTARLARVAAERKLQRERPFSQQDIVAVALDEWLQHHGT
jgi:hypothetical protein